MNDTPIQRVFYEIFDPSHDGDKDSTFDREVAEDAYNRGFLIIEHEIVKAYWPGGRSVTTIISTDWRHQ